MKLLPLLDRTGNVKFWADPRSSWMVDLGWQSLSRRLPLMPSTIGTVFNSDGGTAITSGIEMAKWCCLSPVAKSRV